MGAEANSLSMRWGGFETEALAASTSDFFFAEWLLQPGFTRTRSRSNQPMRRVLGSAITGIFGRDSILMFIGIGEDEADSFRIWIFWDISRGLGIRHLGSRHTSRHIAKL